MMEKRMEESARKAFMVEQQHIIDRLRGQSRAREKSW